MQAGGVEFYIDKEMRRGIAKVIMLSIIKHKKTYPYAILKVLKGIKLMHDERVLDGMSKSDVYNLLSSLEKDGYITGKSTLVGKKVQKIYTTTKKGDSVVKNKDMIFNNMISSMKKLIKEEFYG